MGGLSVRRMRVDDVPAVLEVRFSTVENAITLERLERDYGLTPASIARSMAEGVAGWLCEVEGEVAGFSMGDSRSGEVQVVAVAPRFEGLGIGAAVLARVRDWLFSAGHDEIWLCATPDLALRAHGFYRRLGWEASGRMVGDDEVMTLARR